MQQDFNWLGVSGHDDKLRDTSVQGLGGFVSTLLELSQVLGLGNNVQDLLGQGGVGQWEGFWVRHDRILVVIGSLQNSSPIKRRRSFQKLSARDEDGPSGHVCELPVKWQPPRRGHIGEGKLVLEGLGEAGDTKLVMLIFFYGKLTFVVELAVGYS